MKKNLIKFFITVSILLTTFSTNIFAQNRISGEKLEKLLTENYIIIYDFFGPLRNNDNIEINFDAGSKTYSLKGSFPLQQNIIHPRSGTWEIVGFGKSIVRLDDIQNQNQYTNQNARIQLFFGDDGNIYNINQKLYSYRLENKKERIENNARRIEEERKAEELRLKKIEEEKRQLAIKREQERIKQEEEKKRFQAEYELAVKKDRERREEEEREELYASIVKYSILGLFLLIISFLTYKYKSKINNIYLKFINSIQELKNNIPKKNKLTANYMKLKKSLIVAETTPPNPFAIVGMILFGAFILYGIYSEINSDFNKGRKLRDKAIDAVDAATVCYRSLPSDAQSGSTAATMSAARTSYNNGLNWYNNGIKLPAPNENNRSISLSFFNNAIFHAKTVMTIGRTLGSRSCG